MVFWSWILEAVGLLGAFLAGRRRWYSWLILLSNTILWAIYGFVSKQYGFCVASIAYSVVYTRNMIRWRKLHKKGKADELQNGRY